MLHQHSIMTQCSGFSLNSMATRPFLYTHNTFSDPAFITDILYIVLSLCRQGGGIFYEKNKQDLVSNFITIQLVTLYALISI